jgi:hypothetical protein
MNRSHFKKIIVSKIFEVDNGVLGLDRDCYLNLVKFNYKKSLIKHFVLFNFLFVL